MQVPLTSGVSVSGFAKMDSFISLEQSQMHPSPTKPSQLVPERLQTLKKHKSPKPCQSKSPISSPHRKVIKTSHLFKAHIQTQAWVFASSEDP